MFRITLKALASSSSGVAATLAPVYLKDPNAESVRELAQTPSSMLEEVKDFVAEVLNDPKKGWSAETCINDDLGVDGDDASEFMQSFSERFEVDLTAFPHEKYFGPEAGATPLTFVVGIIRRVTKGMWSDLAPLTLGDLAEAAERRSWKVESSTEL